MEEFKTEYELYQRIKPALLTRKNEINRNGLNYIKEEDVWNYLKEVKWMKSSDLELHEMIADILNCDEYMIDCYLKEKLNLKDRNIYFDKE